MEWGEPGLFSRISLTKTRPTPNVPIQVYIMYVLPFQERPLWCRLCSKDEQEPATRTVRERGRLLCSWEQEARVQTTRCGENSNQTKPGTIKQKKKTHREMEISSLLQALWHLFSQRTEYLTLTSEAIDFPWSKQKWCEEYFKHRASTCEFRGAPLEGCNCKEQCILLPTQYSFAVDRQWSHVNFKDLRASHRDPASSSN